MGAVIKNLLELQEVDLRIISLNDQKTELLNLIRRRKSDFEQRHREFAEGEKQLKHLKVELRNLEVELATAAEHVRKLEGQQINVKTNQEYKALDKEIHEAKVHQARIEDFILQKMELVDQETERIGGARQQLDLQASQLQRESSEEEEKVRQIEARVTKLQAERSERAAAIEDSHLRLYNRIFNNKRPAIVPLVNRTCQGCHLAVPAGIESILRRHESNIITCENCSRILYVPKQERSG